MERRCRLDVLERRDFLVGAAAAALVGQLLRGTRVLAQTPAAGAQEGKLPSYEELMKSILGEARPTTGKIALELPEIAENGNTVPFTFVVESPMTASDHVKAVHILSTANPVAGVATFRFTPLSGKAAAGSRMRLAKTQDVVVVAELSDGRFLLSQRNVKVTIGGCGG